MLASKSLQNLYLMYIMRGSYYQNRINYKKCLLDIKSGSVYLRDRPGHSRENLCRIS